MALPAGRRSDMDRQMKTESAGLKADARRLLPKALRLREEVIRDSEALLHQWKGRVKRLAFRPGAANLANYLALRRHDLSQLQPQLSALGLSSLGRCEGRVRASLDALCATLAHMAGRPVPARPTTLALRSGQFALKREQRAIFGRDPKGPGTRIMVTLPTRAAGDRALVADIIRAGADCMRINCAHDGPDVWSAMIENSRAAARNQRRDCRILMDIAGPKCRMAEIIAPRKTRVRRGDKLTLAAETPAQLRAGEIVIRMSLPEILDQLKVGARVFLDDGRIGTRIERIDGNQATLQIETARVKGEKLRLNKGLNFPDTALNLAPLTDKDLRDLDFVAKHADLIGFSFVQRPADIDLMQRELAVRRRGRPLQPLVIKIETDLAMKNLPELIVQGAGRQPLAVMIARGDLAVELGFGRIGEAQESILWLCEAAHVPVIWATQVLANLVDEGVPSRAEATDAAMAQRAECVMLNKGPFIVEAVSFLDEVLHRMDRHHSKKTARLEPLRTWPQAI